MVIDRYYATHNTMYSIERCFYGMKAWFYRTKRADLWFGIQISVLALSKTGNEESLRYTLMQVAAVFALKQPGFMVLHLA